MMKLKMLFVVMAAVFGMFFCTGLNAQVNPDKVGTPAHVVKTFYRSMANADFATAKNCVGVKELQDMITMLEQLVKELPEMADETKKEFAPVYKSLKFKSEKIDGNNAVVEITAQNPKNKKTETNKHKLKKINGAWKLEE